MGSCPTGDLIESHLDKICPKLFLNQLNFWGYSLHLFIEVEAQLTLKMEDKQHLAYHRSRWDNSVEVDLMVSNLRQYNYTTDFGWGKVCNIVFFCGCPNFLTMTR